ncbi:autotransporter outer membrane beta-barrel domain-containing protein [Mesorhizobium carmichaelinearum]|uniref:autotransporter outer membrane beta-barrel domain-containing protein n=1 Tax=Mesorhizobium carmichaelinearum TaxID=1208188 RepID=UPI000BA4ADBF|nr:autotransporter outer membrane beta-barrel domain-containing protein [Mesorhizobium carmichaelinearum]
MKFLTAGLFASVSAMALTLPATSAHADQSVIQFFICQGPGQNDYCNNKNNTSYIGPGFDSANGSSSVAGGVSEASATNGVVNDAYDGWGAIYGTTTTSGNVYNSPYATPFNGLTAARQTQSYEAVPGLPANSIRWFDSFTNNTGSAISANVAFGGNLGSDSNTYIHASGPGYVVTGQGAPGSESTDPVIAHLYGNNNYAFSQTTVHFVNGDDNPYIVYPLTVAPGQTVSVMNVDILFGDNARQPDGGGSVYAQDVALAIQQAQLFVNSPVFDGLTVEQLQTLVNWNVQVDGSLPAAGAVTGLSQSMHDAFDGILNRDAVIWTNGYYAPGLATGALQYAAETAPGAKQDGAAALANEIGEKGGKVAVTDVDGTRSYIFGGYTTGSRDYSAGGLDFNGYLTGIGIEHNFASGLLVGIAGGYARGSGDIGGVYSDIDNKQYTVSPYVRWQAPTGTILDARISLSSESWTYSRTAGAGTADADIDGSSFGARIGVAQPFDMPVATITPFANLSYLRTHVDGYTETGAGNGNLDVPSYSVDHLEGFVGVSAARDWTMSNGGKLRAFVSAGIGDSFLGNDSVSTSYTSSPTTFLSDIDSQKGAFGRVEAGLSANLTQNLALTSSYGGQFGSGRNQNTISIGLDLKL